MRAMSAPPDPNHGNPACVVNCAVYARDGKRHDIALDAISDVLAHDDGSFIWIGLYEPDDAIRIEETPGEALYQLAGEFEKAGDPLGRVRVLKHLVAHYPKNRFAALAEEDLRTLEGPPPP